MISSRKNWRSSAILDIVKFFAWLLVTSAKLMPIEEVLVHNSFLGSNHIKTILSI